MQKKLSLHNRDYCSSYDWRVSIIRGENGIIVETVKETIRISDVGVYTYYTIG